MVETQGQLSSLVGWHFMLVFATKLGECTNSLVNPLVAIDLLAAAGRGRRVLGSSYDVVDLHLNKVSKNIDFGTDYGKFEEGGEGNCHPYLSLIVDILMLSAGWSTWSVGRKSAENLQLISTFIFFSKTGTNTSVGTISSCPSRCSGRN